MVAGETSGDLLASHVLHHLRTMVPALLAAGIGGPAMQRQSFDAWWPSDALAVRGYVEVLRHLPRILLIRYQLKRRLLSSPPRVFVGVDAPDFNLGLEETLRNAGIPTLHFVSPSIWAWRKERMDRIKRAVSHMLCVFPFEPEIYRAAGMKATYVGHPLADVIPRVPHAAAARQALGLDSGHVVGLLPGSREAEVRYLLPVFLRAAQQIAATHRVQFVLPVAHAGLRAQVDGLVAQHAGSIDLKVVEGQSHQVMEASDSLLIASGTATLEAALYKRPMVIAYRMPWLSWHLLKNKNYLPYVGLPNILCRDFVVPEFIQHDCTPGNLAVACMQQLDDVSLRAGLEQRFGELHSQLAANCAQRVAEVIASHLREGAPA
jgi:lipid-A-disaccharide synthase